MRNTRSIYIFAAIMAACLTACIQDESAVLDDSFEEYDEPDLAPSMSIAEYEEYGWAVVLAGEVACKGFCYLYYS